MCDSQLQEQPRATMTMGRLRREMITRNKHSNIQIQCVTCEELGLFESMTFIRLRADTVMSRSVTFELFYMDSSHILLTVYYVLYLLCVLFLSE